MSAIPQTPRASGGLSPPGPPTRALPSTQLPINNSQATVDEKKNPHMTVDENKMYTWLFMKKNQHYLYDPGIHVWFFFLSKSSECLMSLFEWLKIKLKS